MLETETWPEEAATCRMAAALLMVPVAVAECAAAAATPAAADRGEQRFKERVYE